MSNCLHSFTPHATVAVLFCSHCGEVRSLHSPVSAPLGRRKPGRERVIAPPPAPSSPQLNLPFGMPPAFGGANRSLFEPPDAPPPTSRELDELHEIIDREAKRNDESMLVLSEDPEVAAGQMAAAAKAMGIKRYPPGGDPPNTYRPEDTNAIDRMT